MADLKRRNYLPSLPKRAALLDFRRRREVTPPQTLDAISGFDRIGQSAARRALYKNVADPRTTGFSTQSIAVSRIFHPILFFLANSTRQELARQVAYLKTENQILRARLPKKIVTTAEERRRLVKAGRGLGKAIHELVSIVTPVTFLRWLNADVEPNPKKKPTEPKTGRPKTPDEVRELIVRIAKETGWGYTRILGELRKLGIRVSRQTVVNILKAHGLDPGPTRGKGAHPIKAYLARCKA